MQLLNFVADDLELAEVLALVVYLEHQPLAVVLKIPRLL